MKRLLWAVALALAACGQPQQQQQAGEPAAYSAVEAPNYDASIGPGGAAGITASLPMTLAAVRAAAPRYIAAEAQDQIEGEAFTAITLSAGGEEVFRINPTADRSRIHSIVTRSTQARGPAQEIVGVTLFSVAPPEQVEFCQSEQVDGGAGFACSTEEAGVFWRVYKLPEGYDGPSDPFDSIDPDLLHDAVLVEMRWVALRAP
jgi:hypothetical protein